MTDVAARERWKRVREILEQALDVEGPRREAFLAEACGADAGLRAEVEGLLGAERATGLRPPKPQAALLDSMFSAGDPLRPGHALGPWRLERVLGVGGMGQVWLAQRSEGGFAQRVAIKLIKRGMDTSELLRRFAQERAVLAALEHPNIARLYDGGSSEDGRPYLVMEYIDGEPLDRFCASRDLELGARIGLFISICSAVAHAHRNLIVHRDLKPSNVLVTQDGTPKLLDFGIAKVLDEGGVEPAGERTETAQRVLTPLYASPEQLRGEALTTQSDVYSLGVILYGLLSNAQPFDEQRKPDSEPVLPSQAAQRGPDSALRVRSLAGDLDMIVLKAMRPEPARRYASVEQLAEDLRRFLDGLPVLARPDTFRYRAAKFVRRNRLLVGASVAVGASVLAGLVVSTYLYFDASRARDKEQEQRLLASDRLHSVLAIASSFTRDLDARLGVLHGVSAAREQLLRAAVQQLEKLAQQAPDDPSVQLELGWVYRDLAATLGDPTSNNLGKYAEAEVVYDKAIAVAETLFARDVVEGRYADFASSAFESRGQLLRSLSRLDAARDDGSRAADIAREALSGASGNLEAALIRKLGNSLSLLANLERDEKNFAGAIVFEDEMAAQLERGSAKFPQDPELRYLLGSALYARGVGQYQRDDYPAAVISLERAVLIFTELCAADSENSSFRRALARTQSNLANPLQVLDNTERATAVAHSALDSWEIVVSREPEDEAAFYALIEFANRVGNLEHYNGNSEAAKVAYTRAVEVEDVLIQRHPQDTWRRMGRAFVSTALARAQSELGQWEEALQRAQQALDELDALEDDPGHGTQWRYGRAMITSMSAECRMNAARDSAWPPARRREELERARELFTDARELLVAARADGELETAQIAEIGLIDERFSKLEEIRATLPNDP